MKCYMKLFIILTNYITYVACFVVPYLFLIIDKLLFTAQLFSDIFKIANQHCKVVLKRCTGFLIISNYFYTGCQRIANNQAD